MPPLNKAKAAGVSASSFQDLRAELAKKEEEFSKSKVANKSAAVVGGVKRPDKKSTVWGRQNKGVNARATRDVELEEISKHTMDSARAILERKAQVYEKLRKGKSGGLNEKQYESLLVDFDSKPAEAYESDSDDVDESLTVPKPSGEEDDPIIEYEDEFGRARTGRRSEIPRHLLENEEAAEEDIDPFVIYNPVNHFPTYQPSGERIAAIQAELSEENNPHNIHYDASREVRAKGAGFYQFSADEETRKKQMEELDRAREETGKTREEMGAVDVLPGQVEGMTLPEEPVSAAPMKSRALEKRKRELAERRKLIDAKRRKKGPTTDATSTSPPPTVLSASTTFALKDSEDAVGHPPRNAAASVVEHFEGSMPPDDPFAVLESQVTSRQRSKGKAPMKAPATSADAFLASLERDIAKGAN